MTKRFICLLLLLTLFSMGRTFAAGVRYSAHVADKGWMTEVENGATAGTTGENRRLEAVRIYALDCPPDTHVLYQPHVQDYGWRDYAMDNAIGGSTGEAKRLEAIKIKLSGPAAATHDIYYRSHVSDFGWLGWAKNDEVSGSTGHAKQMEAIEIIIVPKGDPAPGPTERPAVEKSSGALRVEGTRLVDKNGNPVQLRGVSTHGLAWYPQYVNQQLASELKNNWGANVLRLALYTDEYGGYCSGGDKESLKKLVRNGVDYASKAGLYAIVDWHVLNDQDPNAHKAEAREFFNQISSDLSGYDNVLYEICNEPNGSATWAGIKSYASEIIPVIRAHDNDAVIIVGTPNWSQRVDQALADPIASSNIMYALHFYAGTHKDDLRNTMTDAVSKGLPVFVSEFGITDASGNGNLDIDSANKWVAEMNRLGISYVCWNLSNKDESSALIKSSVTKTAGFSRDDLSGQGQWLLDVLGSPDLTPGTPTPSPEPSPAPEPAQKPTYQLTQTNSWTSGDQTFYQYSLTINNTSATQLNDWKATIDFNQAVSLVNSWNGNFSVSGSSITITPLDYNATVAPNSSVTDVGFILSSGAGLTYTVE